MDPNNRDALFDVAVIGGGIVGLATARAVAQSCRAKIILLEAEPILGGHQTGHNSGVMHSGLYYKEGSHKARNCVQGRRELAQYCAERGIAMEPCGKLVVATNAAEAQRLEALMARGQANGLLGLRRIPGEEIPALEPHARGVAALVVPETGIVDFRAVAAAYAQDALALGAEIVVRARVLAIKPTRDGELVLESTAGRVRARALINCAGLQCDRVARMAGIKPPVRIVPFRGEYYELTPEARRLVRALIYPVPDPALPFLGVHFTRRVTGEVEAGPNAVLALAREGYRKRTANLRDLGALLSYVGFWRMGLSHLGVGIGETYRSWSKAAFVRALQRLLPELTSSALGREGAGVRAQAVDPRGKLCDDFCIVEGQRMVHVLNAPSPAATASLAIGASIAEVARRNFELASRGF